MRYNSQYARLGDVIKNHIYETRKILALTLYRGNSEVLLKSLLANFPKLVILAEATYQEESRAADRRSLRKTTRKGDSGLQLSVCGDIRYGPRQMNMGQTPPGILTPDIMAPDGGTTRGRPAGVGRATRSVSLMIAVCSILRTRPSLAYGNTLAMKGSFSSSS